MIRELLFRASRFFVPAVNWIVLVVFTGVVLGNLLLLISMRHERRQLEREVCAAELRAVKARTPALARLLHPDDPCIALRLLEP